MSGTVRTAARRVVTARRRVLAGVGAGLVPVVVAVLAIIYPGSPVSQVDLNDGTVWLTNTSELKLGRYNPQVEELNGGLVTDAGGFNVLQDEQDVLLTSPGRVSVVDPASVALGAQISVPFGAVASMAGGTVAVTDAGAGAVWARTTAMIGALSTDTQAPDLDLGPGGTAVVARDGTVLAAESDGSLLRAVVSDGGLSVEEVGALAGPPAGAAEQVTAVGDQLVVLVGATVHTPSGQADLSAYGAGLVLQQPGPAGTSVLVAGRTALLEVPLDGGAVREHVTGGSGTPAAPVVVGRCGHGAWASAVGSYLQLCDGGDPVVTNLQQMTTADELVFRVNREVIVLNDTLRGRLWLPLEDPELREPNWQDIEREDETQEAEETDSQQSAQSLLAECTASSAAPSAVDDAYGVRPGRTTTLSVIDNDGSSDCGILVISEFDPIDEGFGLVQSVHGGRALQLTTAVGASGSVVFRYTVTDGRGTTAPATAEVRLTVVPPGENQAPAQLRTSAMAVEQGASATAHVLQDFQDPDGDDLILVSALAEAGGTVRTRQDGEVTFQSDGSALGRQQVLLQVSDGTETVEGLLTVDIRPVGSLPPVVDPVHAVAYVDETVVLHPLESVRSLSREPVRLAGVDETEGATITTDLGAGTFTFTAPRAGTYYVPFLVTAAPQQAGGLARIDVRERPEVVPPPIAVRDRALLPPNGEVTIDPLANDVDPGGGVLVLQSVEVPSESGVRVAVLHHQLVRIDSLRVLEGPVTATYTVSNGLISAVGEILIQPIPASATAQAPVVPNVTASVRTGGVVTVPVLEGAYDPDGDPLILVRDLAEPLGPGQGLLFVSGDVLRYQAPATAMDVHATFSVKDPAGNTTAATLTVSVHASDPATKPLPRPAALTARVFEGETIRIPVPLTGIDDDGDGVMLLGQDEAPAKGRIVGMGADWLEYEALPGETGTDRFTYAVEDWVGQRATGTIAVGIAPRPTTSAQVVSRNDDITVRPGQAVEVRVLLNDVDTGGGELTLMPDLVHQPEVDATVVGRRIVVNTPDEAAVLQVQYTATNVRGGIGTAVLTVTVTPDAPILAPIADDVVVPATDTINKTTVIVDVLAVAQNPSGPLSDLAVSVDPSVATVASVADRKVVITLIDRAQTLPYLLTNTTEQAAGLSSYAFITVPALGDFPPMLRPGAAELRVVAGEQLEISLDEYIQVAPGRTARILDAASVEATKSDGTSLIKDARTLLYRSQLTYAGPASISFEVSDGEAGDLTARTKVMTLPITVLAAADYPPTFKPSVIDIAPDESVRVDLTAFTSTPVGTQAGDSEYTYRLLSELPAGFTQVLTGSVLTVTAASTVPKGTAAGLQLEIGYGVAGTLAAQVDFRVVASIRQLARMVDVTVPDGVEGGASTVSVLEGAFNPFPGQPMTVVGATVETPGAGTASVSDSQVTVRPAAGYIGSMVTRYRVRDVTGDPEREVEGRITVIVRGRPAAPTAPRVGEVRDRTVVLAWDAPVNNGEPITEYRVTGQPGGVTQSCASTTCTIAGLTNNVEYTFTVQARNAVDWSPDSPTSAVARPDAVPDAPAAPRLTFGDKSMIATWDAPASTGSPIASYTVELSPANVNGQTSFTTSSTSLTLTNLNNGTSYQVRVRAHNLAPDPGPWSGFATEIPAGRPGAPAVTATRVADEIGKHIVITWAPGAANGDAIIDYELVISGGAGATTVTEITGTSHDFVDAANGVGYTFAVRARNKAGLGETGTATASTWGVPLAAEAPSLRASGDDDRLAFGAGWVELDWPEVADNGSPVTHHMLNVHGVGERRLEGRGSSTTVAGLLGGQAYTFEVRGCNEAGCGPWSPAITTAGEDIPRTRPNAVSSVSFGEPVWENGWPVSVTATWTEPSGWGGGTSPRYTYTFLHGSEEVGGGEVPQGTRTATLTIQRDWFHRDDVEEIRVEVTAVTSTGDAEEPVTARIEIAVQRPGVVASPVLTLPDRTAAVVRWSPPAANNGPAPTRYVVQFRINGGAWEDEITVPATEELKASILVDAAMQRDGGNVDARVRAVNEIGEGGWAEAPRLRVDPPPPDPPPVTP